MDVWGYFFFIVGGEKVSKDYGRILNIIEDVYI